MADGRRNLVLYSGNVQGVGFRYTTAQIAERFAVSGYVRNLPDGRVEIVAEGSPAELRAFEDQILSAMRENIDDWEVRESPTTDEFDGFNIRF